MARHEFTMHLNLDPHRTLSTALEQLTGERDTRVNAILAASPPGTTVDDVRMTVHANEVRVDVRTTEPEDKRWPPTVETK